MRKNMHENYRRIGGGLSANKIAGNLWAVIADSNQFFFTFPTEEEFMAEPQRNMPCSNLEARQHLIGMNIMLNAQDTPKS